MADAFEAWRGFWSTAAGISATLLGFLFLTIVLERKQSGTQQRRDVFALASQSLIAYAAVAIVGLLVQIPMSPRRVGAALAALGFVLVIGCSWSIARAPKSGGSSLWAFSWTRVGPWIAYLVILWSGVKLARGASRTVDFLGMAAFGLLILAGAINLLLLRRAEPD